MQSPYVEQEVYRISGERFGQVQVQQKLYARGSTQTRLRSKQVFPNTRVFTFGKLHFVFMDRSRGYFGRTSFLEVENGPGLKSRSTDRFRI